MKNVISKIIYIYIYLTDGIFQKYMDILYNPYAQNGNFKKVKAVRGLNCYNFIRKSLL